ncbi:DEKNAAC102201 [Brettanomyces naardenensis]|uniref:DEKNAAC102201 n=1 Tax=Brettanomyces naardenensis TaxID=13370 RepID=A0A448YJY6_BRENA|nr:DEKNAAC102201 [Brettanomyces naardenensis]
MSLLDLLVALMSPDNELRTRSELEFRNRAELDPDSFLLDLSQLALNSHIDNSLRLAAVLHLKRYVPKFWSPAFDNFVGPNTTSQQVKQTIRSCLFSLLGDPSSKIRNAAAYAMIQIAVVDYPDEWPNLMNELYGAIVNSNPNPFLVLGSLSALHQLFDDLVTDEQFFQGGIAVEVMKACEVMLTDDSYGLQVKVATLPLVKAIIDMLVDIAYYEDSQKRNFVEAVIPRLLDLLMGISSRITSSPSTDFVTSIMFWDLKSEIYDCLNALVNSFSRFFKGRESSSSPIDLVVTDLSKEIQTYLAIFCDEDSPSSIFSDLALFEDTEKEGSTPSDVMVECVRFEIEYLQAMLELQPFQQEDRLSSLIDLLCQFNYLTADKLSAYQSDFNEFVTDETDLSIDTTVRSSVIGFFTELNGKDIHLAIEMLSKRLTSALGTNGSDRTLESLSLMLTCAFDNDAKTSFEPPEKFFEIIMSFMDERFNHLSEDSEILLSRFVILLPKFLMKYDDKLKSLALPSLHQLVSYLDRLGDGYQILKSAILIAFQYYNQFIRASEFDGKIQFKLMTAINQLKEDSDEDTNIMMLEALTILISIDNRALSTSDDAFLLVLAIGYKDCSNFSLNTPTLECISDLIKDLPLESYMMLSSKALGHIIDIIFNANGEYSAEVDLTLQILAEYIKGPVEGFQLPHELFIYVFPPVCKFIMTCNDDHLLQSASTAFNEIVQRSSKEVELYRDLDTGETGNEILLKIVAKFLAPGVSDHAIVNLGSLIVLIIDNFGGSDLIKRYFEDMLRGITLRLLNSQEVPTIENMILIFNKLMATSPHETMAFLKGFNVDGQGSALAKVLPIWFQAFEVMRGYDKILDNVKAFAELLKMNDHVLAEISVNGDLLPNQVPDDLIVTRSMTKKMELQYELIPADSKIIRLLVKELKFQLQSALQEEKDAVADARQTDQQAGSSDEDDSDEWEDLEDVGVPSFNELKHYVEDGSDSSYFKRSERANSSIKDYLIGFFRECFNGKVNRFKEIYTNYLNDADKKLLTESLVFA